MIFNFILVSQDHYLLPNIEPISGVERNHNIRIPGFASDETRLSLSQSTVAPTVPTTNNAKKPGGQQGTQMTLRSHRLAQVAQAKREAKLI